MDVERKGDGEGGDVSNQRGPRFAREKRERVRGENERKSRGSRTGQERKVCLVDRGKWSVKTVTVKVWKVQRGGGVVVVGG